MKKLQPPQKPQTNTATMIQKKKKSKLTTKCTKKKATLLKSPKSKSPHLCRSLPTSHLLKATTLPSQNRLSKSRPKFVNHLARPTLKFPLNCQQWLRRTWNQFKSSTLVWKSLTRYRSIVLRATSTTPRSTMRARFLTTRERKACLLSC
jgi:hypothetical protein